VARLLSSGPLIPLSQSLSIYPISSFFLLQPMRACFSSCYPPPVRAAGWSIPQAPPLTQRRDVGVSDLRWVGDEGVWLGPSSPPLLLPSIRRGSMKTHGSLSLSLLCERKTDSTYTWASRAYPGRPLCCKIRADMFYKLQRTPYLSAKIN
jgi:hypothetical protein